MTMPEQDPINVMIRPATPGDGSAIVALDDQVTGENKAAFWTDILARYSGDAAGDERFFLAAEAADGQLAGFIVGEIRAWEFGSPPCGWVIALNVNPALRERGIGTQLFDALCDEMQALGITTIRTMVRRDDKVNLSFFRGEGLAAGPYIELERHLD
jgi:ribosomal protein S18 acetylase RimI-like enzyme